MDSCRVICMHYMCGDCDACSPANWNEDCASGNCVNCPAISFPVPSGEASTLVTVSLWTQKEIAGRKKFGLFKVSMTVQELSKDLESMIRPKMTEHIRMAAIAWARVHADISQLEPGMILTMEDYQRNYEIFHAEMPTSTAFSANTIQLAMYPIGVKFKREVGGPVETGAVIFISPDLKHCHQQVEVFMKA